uniref:Uncharacterized protein n=1 Tax=Anguilla anguilla TaxID=7936 RepID=A0A0E9S5V7_ANGAN
MFQSLGFAICLSVFVLFLSPIIPRHSMTTVVLVLTKPSNRLPKANKTLALLYLH